MNYLSMPSAALRKRILVNYIGGVGYYTILFTLLLWVINLYMKLETYLLFTPRPAEEHYTLAQSVATAHSPSILSLIFIYIFTFFMIVITIAIVLLVPYVIGKYASRAFHRLFSMTGQSKSLARLLVYKLSCCAIMVGTVLVTEYNYHFEIIDNWFSAVLILMSAVACFFFWLQHLLARIWKLPFKNVF